MLHKASVEARLTALGKQAELPRLKAVPGLMSAFMSDWAGLGNSLMFVKPLPDPRLRPGPRQVVHDEGGVRRRKNKSAMLGPRLVVPRKHPVPFRCTRGYQDMRDQLLREYGFGVVAALEERALEAYMVGSGRQPMLASRWQAHDRTQRPRFPAEVVRAAGEKDTAVYYRTTEQHHRALHQVMIEDRLTLFELHLRTQTALAYLMGRADRPSWWSGFDPDGGSSAAVPPAPTGAAGGP